MNLLVGENIGIYIGMAFSVLVAIAAIIFILWSARPLFKTEFPQKRFWIYSISRKDGSGRRWYFGVDFYDQKNPNRCRQYEFPTAHEAFFATKEYQDSGEYEIELLTKKEFDARWEEIHPRSGNKKNS